MPARTPVSDPAAAWQARQSQIASINAWNIDARLALRRAEEGAQATLRWVRRADRETIDLSGPFGGGRVRLTRDAAGVVLRDSNQQEHRAANARELLRQATGWELPIEHLDDWVRGVPAPDRPATYTLDEYGRLERLHQSGWEVRFTAYAEYDGYELPRRLIITPAADAHPMDAPPEVEVRVVVEQFRVVR